MTDNADHNDLHSEGMKTSTLAYSLVFALGTVGDSAVDALLKYAGASAFGAAVGNAGDVNGDGTNDLIVGEPNWMPGHPQGRVFVYSGKDYQLLHEFRGPKMGAAIGRAVASAGDVNSDGCDDVIFGSYLGEIEVRSGRTGTVLYAIAGIEDGFGCAVDGGRDVNADGVPDILIGATVRPDSGRAPVFGYAYVFSGADGRLLHRVCQSIPEEQSGEVGRRTLPSSPQPPTECTGIKRENRARTAFGYGFGKAVSFAGDVNSDGYEDFVVGAPEAYDGAEYVGSVTLYSGHTGAPLWSVHGWIPGGRFGWSIAQLGDVNGDEISDLVVGAIEYSIFVLSGKTGDEISRVCGRTMELTGFADSVCRIGDVDGDASPEFVVGSREDARDAADLYQVRIYSGSHGSALYALPEVVPEPLRICDFVQRNYRDGWTVVGPVGDVDDDGLDDYAVGLPLRGIVRVVSSREQRDLFLLTPPGEELPFEWGPNGE